MLCSVMRGTSKVDGQEAVGSGTLQSFFVKSLTASLASDLTVIVLVTSPLAAEADNACMCPVLLPSLALVISKVSPS